MGKSISSFFEYVGAPLVNTRLSWGAARDDGSVVLRVWQNEKIIVDGKHYYQLTHHGLYEERQNNNGYQERLSHIRDILGGSPCYFIMCKASDPDVIPRTIKDYDDERVFEVGELVKYDNEIYAEMARPVPTIDFIGLEGAAA